MPPGGDEAGTGGRQPQEEAGGEAQGWANRNPAGYGDPDPGEREPGRAEYFAIRKWPSIACYDLLSSPGLMSGPLQSEPKLILT